MKTQPSTQRPRAGEERRGVVLLLTAILLVTIFGFVAFSVDYGYMSMVQGGLQNAADSAALAAVVELGDGEAQAVLTAEELAGKNAIGSYAPTVTASGRTQAGVYDMDAKTFTPTNVGPNAIRVRAELTRMPLFFAPVIGHDDFSTHAEAIAMTKPREIVIAIDLSGTMNNDTETAWAPNAIANQASSRGVADPNVAHQLSEQLYQDLGFGAYPGDEEHIGQGLVPDRTYSYALLTNDVGPLTLQTNNRYRIQPNHNENARKKRAYRWIIDNQLARLMPDARPFPDSRNGQSYQFWEKYLDYVIYPYRWQRVWGPREGQAWGSVWLPHNQDSDRMYNMSNPAGSFPGESNSYFIGKLNKVGYRTYVNYLQDWGRDRAPKHSNDNNAAPGKKPKVELSVDSPWCRMHTEDVDGDSFEFPPRTYPMHACRRSVIRALQYVKRKNDGVSASVADRVSIVTFDALTKHHEPELLVPLTSDYDAAMLACTTMQAVGDRGASTASQPGLTLAREQLVEAKAGGPARNNSTKVLIFLTDGKPNLYDMSNNEIDDYIADNPSTDYYTGGGYYDYAKNAALIQNAKGVQGGELTYSVGMGLSADYDFMDRMSRTGQTAKGGKSPRTSGDPAEYEESITELLTNIIRHAGVSLVQ